MALTFRQGVFTAICKHPISLLELVAEELSRFAAPDSDARSLLDLGAIYVNDERAFASDLRLKIGDQIRVHSSPRRFARPADLRERILNETGETLLIEKPYGLPSEATVDNARENLIGFLEELRHETFFLVHRAAAESEGLVLLAKTKGAADRLKLQFAKGLIVRRYAAYTLGPFASSAVVIRSSEIFQSPTQILSEGRTIWVIQGEPLGQFYRSEIEFTSLRPKEVREAFAANGTPILGDNGSRVRLRNQSGKSDLAFKCVWLAPSEI